jgi:hypothetical protein
VWQSLREELHPKGLEIVTVALDTGGADAARQFVEAANPAHPSLVDQAHLLDELFGVVNVPNGVWIDEAGMVVRPAEPAPAPRSPVMEQFRNVDLDTLPEQIREIFVEVRKIRSEPDKYIAGLRDWVDNGAASRFALSPDEVVRRSTPRPASVAEAAAAFELGQHLHRNGDADAAVKWFKHAHSLQPDNWTYKREAWNLVSPGNQGPNGVYEGNWVADVKAIGAENYYPPLDM